MNKINFTVILGLILCFGTIAKAEAKTMTATCDEIKGPQTYYFSTLINPNSGYTTNKFYDHESGMSDEKLTLVWQENKETAQVAITNSYKDFGQEQFILIFNDKDPGTEQMTFVGAIHGAPIMLSIYPKMKVAIYTQHSTWSGIGQGIRAFMFHAKCNIDFS